MLHLVGVFLLEVHLIIFLAIAIVQVLVGLSVELFPLLLVHANKCEENQLSLFKVPCVHFEVLNVCLTVTYDRNQQIEHDDGSRKVCEQEESPVHPLQNDVFVPLRDVLHPPIYVTSAQSVKYLEDGEVGQTEGVLLDEVP